MLADKGHDLRLIQDYLGHRDPRHPVHYTRTQVGASRGHGDDANGHNAQLRGHWAKLAAAGWAGAIHGRWGEGYELVETADADAAFMH